MIKYLLANRVIDRAWTGEGYKCHREVLHAKMISKYEDKLQDAMARPSLKDAMKYCRVIV